MKPSRIAQNVARAREATPDEPELARGELPPDIAFALILMGYADPLPTQDERLEAARALGMEHALPEPQEEMKLTKGGRDE